MKSGNVDFIEVTSQRGGPCTLRNYWGKQSVDLYRNNNKSETLSAELLTFRHQAGREHRHRQERHQAGGLPRESSPAQR